MKNIQMRFLRLDQLELATHIICKSFIANNQIWKSLNANDQHYQTFFQAIKPQMELSCKKKLLGGIFVNQVLVGVSSAYQIKDYLKISYTQTKSQILQTLKKYGQLLEQPLKKIQHDSSTLYFRFLAILPEYASKSLGEYFQMTSYMALHQMGYKVGYSRITHPFAKKLLLKVGGEVINSIKTDKQQQIYLGKLELCKIPPIMKEIMKKSSL